MESNRVGRREDSSNQPHIYLVTDEKDKSIHWFRQGLQKSLDGYASITLVDRSELNKIVEDGGAIHTVIVDTVYTHNWEAYLPDLKSERIERFIVASAAPNWKDARKALLAGASDYITQHLIVDDLRENILRR